MFEGLQSMTGVAKVRMKERKNQSKYKGLLSRQSSSASCCNAGCMSQRVFTQKTNAGESDMPADATAVAVGALSQPLRNVFFKTGQRTKLQQAAMLLHYACKSQPKSRRQHKLQQSSHVAVMWQLSGSC